MIAVQNPQDPESGPSRDSLPHRKRWMAIWEGGFVLGTGCEGRVGSIKINYQAKAWVVVEVAKLVSGVWVGVKEESGGGR